MDRISTGSSYQSALLSILQGQNRQADAQARVSSGYVGNDLKAYAGQADTLTALKTVASKLDSYVNSTGRAADRLASQDQALNAVSDSASGTRQTVLDAVANGDGSTLISTLQGWYSQAVDALNTNTGGDYLFAGGKTTTKPIASDQLSDIPTGPIATLFNNDGHKAQARLDDNITLTTGVLASDAGTPLFSALQQVVAFNNGPNGPFSGKLTAAQESSSTASCPPCRPRAQPRSARWPPTPCRRSASRPPRPSSPTVRPPPTSSWERSPKPTPPRPPSTSTSPPPPCRPRPRCFPC